MFFTSIVLWRYHAYFQIFFPSFYPPLTPNLRLDMLINFILKPKTCSAPYDLQTEFLQFTLSIRIQFFEFFKFFNLIVLCRKSWCTHQQNHISKTALRYLKLMKYFFFPLHLVSKIFCARSINTFAANYEYTRSNHWNSLYIPEIQN